MKLIYKLSMFSVLAASSLVSTNILAGAKEDHKVQVTRQFIIASMGDARNSSDGVQSIHIEDGGNYNTIWATTASGRTASCTTDNAEHLAALRSASSDSYIVAQYRSGVCTIVKVYKGSQYAPKKAD